MKPLCIFSLIFTTLILFLYPFVLMANVMSLAAVKPDVPLPAGIVLASSVFLWGSTFYPLPYLVCLVMSLWNFRKNIRRSLWWQAGLCAYLFVVGAAFAGWLFLD